MKLREKTTATLLILLTATLFIPMIIAAPRKQDGTLQEGEIVYSASHYLAGQAIPVGFDIFGYNYQAHMFKGYYCNVYLGRDNLPPFTGDVVAYLAANPTAAGKWYWFPDVMLVMKWNDVWLSNMDRDGDSALDRHYGSSSYIGSGAWETNHQWGTNPDGTQWNYFCKIVAAPSGATVTGGIWYAADGVTEIGTVIWGDFAYIFDVTNDPMFNQHGVQYNPPSPTGFGYYN